MLNMSRQEKTIEYLFYLMILLYFVGKTFKPITLIINIIFIYMVFKNKNFFIEYFKEYRKLIYAFLVFIVYLLFQSIVLEYHWATFRHSFQTIMYIILVFAIVYIFNTQEKIRKVIYISFIALFIVAFDTLFQYFNGTDIFGFPILGTRLTAWHDAPKVNILMGQFFGLLIASIFLLKDNMKKVAIFMLLLSFMVFILAGNRSPVLALFSTLIVVGIFSSYRKYFIGGMVVVTLLFSLLLTDAKVQKSYDRLYKVLSNPMQNLNENSSNRIPIFLTGVEILKDNLIFGIGAYNYKLYHKEYYFKSEVNAIEYRNGTWAKVTPTNVHSILLDQLISYGLLGFIIFAFAFYRVYETFIKGNEIGLLASIGLLYTITPLGFSKAFTQDIWQFITYLGLIFLVLLSRYETIKKDNDVKTV